MSTQQIVIGNLTAYQLKKRNVGLQRRAMAHYTVISSGKLADPGRFQPVKLSNPVVKG